MKRIYSLETSEPGYSGSEETVCTGSLSKNISALYQYAKAYKLDRENNPSHAVLFLENEEVLNFFLETLEPVSELQQNLSPYIVDAKKRLRECEKRKVGKEK